MRPSVREVAYGLLALLGLVATMYFNIQYAAQSDAPFNLLEFIRLGFVNPASSSLSADVLIAYVAFLLWVIPESKRVGMRHGWVYVVVSFFTAFAFAFPLFLMIRERRLRWQFVSR